jgi:hypothetical protein
MAAFGLRVGSVIRLVDTKAQKDKGDGMNSENSKSENSVRVEAYLDQVLAPLTRQLAPFHQGELRRELREHLWEHVSTYQELGQSEDDAVTEALRQFGGAQDFLRQWQREWAQAARIDARGWLWQATLAGLRLSAVALLLACTPVIVWVSQAPLYGHAIPWLKSWLDGYPSQLGALLAWSDFVVLPALLGIMIGRRSPQRAGSGAFLALLGEIIAGAFLDGIGMKLWPCFPVFSDILGQAALMECAWLPITCLFASLTGWGIQRSKSRRLA